MEFHNIIINIFHFLDTQTSIKLSKTNKKNYKIFSEIYPSIKYVKLFPYFIIELLGGIENFISFNSYKKRNVSVGINENKIFFKLKYYFRNKEYTETFIQKNETNYNIWNCNSISLVFLNNEYDMANLDEVTEYNIKNICKMKNKIKVYDFMNDINNQLFFYDDIYYY